MIDIKRYLQEVQIDPVTGQPVVMLVSNMGLDADAGMNAKSVQHFCVDCCMPFREERMIKFRGLWYGVPCGDYKHAISIYTKEKERAWYPERRNEPGEVPFVTSTNW
jgi:hypothetical protein